MSLQSPIKLAAMQEISFPAQWHVRAVSNFDEIPPEIGEKSFPAQVPGCVHLDLLRENLIPDPYLGQNENLVQWIGRTDWEFSTTFSVSDALLGEERIDLVCEGLDTVATIWVNGIEVGKSENMHVEARFDIKNALLSKVPTTNKEEARANKKEASTPFEEASTNKMEARAPFEESSKTSVESPTDFEEVAVPFAETSANIEENCAPFGVGEHEIRVVFSSAVHYARAMRDKLGDLPHASSFKDKDGVCEPFHFIRKNACNFGWDWGPGLITAGIWKAIRVEAWSVARIKSVRPIVRVANEKFAVVDVEVELEYFDEDDEDKETSLIDVWMTRDEGVDSEKGVFLVEETLGLIGGQTITFLIREPKLWWPRGYGEQHLYGLNVRTCLESEQSSKSASYHSYFHAQIGLREVELDTSPDEIGAVWVLKVNGQKIWCKGANWIPDDVFLPRANEPQRLQTRLQQAADAGMNMIRVWGGGIYETDEFYEICDQMGLLVWQDFLFACAAYSEESPMKELVEAEARFNVARLTKHPSLVLWNGNNENIWGYFDWGWQKELNGRTWGGGYYLDLLPKIVAELAPTTPYWPGSPYSGSMEIHPLADQYGPKHIWDVWNDVDYVHFRRYSPRFASEFGHQAPPTYATLKRSIPEAELNPFSPSMLLHQKASGGNDKLHARLEEHFERPESFDDWLYLTQLVQARSITTAVEWFRTRAACSGALYWQLNDCWPVTSWAAIDGDGRPKPLYYATKQFFRERLLTIQPDGEYLALWAHNDSDEHWNDSVWLDLHRMDGYRDQSGLVLNAAPHSLVKVATLESIKPQHKQDEFICAHATYTQTNAFWFFDIDKNLAHPEPKWTATTEGNTLKITAQTLLRDFYINADRFGGTMSENLVTLLPGETWETQIEGISPEDLALVDFSSRPIVNCANYFGRK